MMLTSRQIKDFISAHRLPGCFHDLIATHYAPLASWVQQQQQHQPGQILLLGISGAQGTGKTTLSAYLQLALQAGAGWRSAVLSIDDFYLTRQERKRLGENTHPLLTTRGVPGTHDLNMLASCIGRLKALGAGMHLPLPRFDKAQDDRSKPDSWPVVTGPIDLIILEGWCVGSAPEPGNALKRPINKLEQEKDADGTWRRFVNEQLKGDYSRLFAQLDKLVFLKAPDFDSVYRWRYEQEEKLAAGKTGQATRMMTARQLAYFMQHFERLTRANLACLPATADVVLNLDDKHNCVQSSYVE